MTGSPPDSDRAQRTFDYLRERIPTLATDLLDDPHRRLRDVLPHSHVQTILGAVKLAAPHLDRRALSDATFAALVDWVGPVLDEGGISPTRLSPGSYHGPSIGLRPLRDRDVALLYEASLAPTAAHRWRFRGRTPSPAEFRDHLFSPATLAQLIVTPEDDAQQSPVGLVCAYDADFQGRHCSIAFQRLLAQHAPKDSGGLMIEGLLVFIQYVFDHFDFRKLYIEVPEYNRSLLGDDGSRILFVKEGEYPDHHYFGDRLWALDVLAVYRTRWDQVAAAFVREWPDRAPQGPAAVDQP